MGGRSVREFWHWNDAPDGLFYVGKWVFGYKDYQRPTVITLKEGTEYIADCASRFNRNLTKVNLPNTLKGIGESAFSSCQNLTSVNIPSSIKSIGKDAFFNCNVLRSVVFPKSPMSIVKKAFCRSALDPNSPTWAAPTYKSEWVLLDENDVKRAQEETKRDVSWVPNVYMRDVEWGETKHYIAWDKKDNSFYVIIGGNQAYVYNNYNDAEAALFYFLFCDRTRTKGLKGTKKK